MKRKPVIFEIRVSAETPFPYFSTKMLPKVCISVSSAGKIRLFINVKTKIQDFALGRGCQGMRGGKKGEAERARPLYLRYFWSVGRRAEKG